ncbi:hypothetical protein AB4Z18_17340 [Leifsonia sp. 2TAF2]|uniref:hypothetical protein n=1 Tax=Leifsonia sp. 2TAF2 TaxID=3233009 RepID=UPI003F998689
MPNEYQVTFQILAGPDHALELNGDHFIGVPTRPRAEEVAARLRTAEGAQEKVAELREREEYASYDDLRLGEVGVLGPDA